MENLRKEIKSFKESLVKMSPDQIFEKGEKIAFYKEVENLLEDGDEINNYFTPEEIEKLQTAENILHKSYTVYKYFYVFPISICYEDVTGVIKEQLKDVALSTQDFIDQTEEITLADIEAWCNKTGEKVEDIVNQIIPTLSISEYLVAIGAEDLGITDFDILFNYTEGMGYWSFCLEDLSEIPNLKEVALVEGKRYFETVQTDCI